MNPAGANTLFKEVFYTTPAVKQRKGRSLSLIEKRNECLVDRYYFHGRKKVSYAYLLEIISNEFFLSMVTIPEVIEANFNTLASLKKQWHDQDEKKLAEHLRKKWPHLMW